MQSLIRFGAFGRIGILTRWQRHASHHAPSEFGWRLLPLAAQLYVALVIVVGTAAGIALFPTTVPRPGLFVLLLAAACLTSAWKVTLPIPSTSGATLSVSYAACLMSLLLLGPEQATLIAAGGVWVQCTYRAKPPAYPLYRSLFSVAVAIITMGATSVVFRALGGSTAPLESLGSAKPIVGAITTYFLVNTSLIAGVIACSTRQQFLTTWRHDFVWVGASFMVAGGVGALAAVIVAHGQHWKAVLVVAPVYLIYRTYQLIVGRLDDEKRHTAEMHRLHQETMAALAQARHAERALSAEKERLAQALADMTRLEHARNQLLEREQAARASAEAANRLKDEFLAIVSHELRTPLNAILGWADMLQRNGLPPSLGERARRGIYDSAKRQAQLIGDLLDIARITSGKLRLDRSVVVLKDVVGDALQVVQSGADVKGIRIQFENDAATAAVCGDAARLQQIALNLISNAVKFTPAGGAVHVRLRRAGDYAELMVADTGQGIASEFLPSVFEPFRQADGSTTRAHGGLGLGLSIVKNLVDAHHGSVTAWSDGEGRGATFTVRLPIASREAALGPLTPALATRETSEAVNLPSLDGISVLVVDDDRDSRDMLAAHLQACQAAVLTADSAADAFELLQREHVDVLLADIGMPGEDGYSFMRRVRASTLPRAASLPAAAVTAFAREADRKQALHAGFQKHLAKPIQPRALVEAVAGLRKLTKSDTVQTRAANSPGETAEYDSATS